MADKFLRKARRREFSPVGWALLIYWGIMNLVVAVFVVIDAFRSGSDDGTQSGGWGYILTCAIGLLLILIWKGRHFYSREIFARGKPMKTGSFFTLLSLLMACQLVFKFLLVWQEILMNNWGGSMINMMENSAIDTDNLSMFLYAGIVAPVVEELIFRGLILRCLLPRGKKLAILGSAFLFAMFHGNYAQAPFAFAAGVVFAYAAVEYSILWAMVLHMFNNLILSDALTRLFSGLPDGGSVLITLIILGFSIAALVLMIRKRREIAGSWKQDPMDREAAFCFFTSPGVVTITVVLWLNMGLTVLSGLIY